MIERRRFLRNVALASAAAAIAPARVGAVVSSAAAGTRGAAATLSVAAFARLRGAEFAVGGPDRATQRVVLAHVCEYDRGPQIENFSVQFEGHAGVALPEGIHRFSHRDLGTFELFVVARRRDEQTCAYEAVFNRLR